jgi:RNA polymerase sigma-54 factor
MEAVARKVGVHPATVSRTVRDKYASTPKGVVELRRFFTSGYSGENGESVSRDALQERIRELIAGEEPSRPYSDDRISELLKNEGFTVARRTVAKYRAILGIPGASERKVR